ncbi:unnamed protein product [Lepeophtheirus salmonis]|uniref:(salmon louse) hypothetical protein n=1 Tax=Lepeophtheirus salmonis TaxID=72036 RepID=A0A7R8H4N5_LEPSM|nr:unnamed protein product [Lepeophtheirus salmonis]CAF2851570.1 unnamed protein product [Lepeophtheirus salmonis]
MKILVILGFIFASTFGNKYQHPLLSYPSPFYPSQSQFYASQQPFFRSNSHPVLYPFPIQTSTPRPIIVATPVPIFVTPDSLFNSQRDAFSSGSNTGNNFNNEGQFGNNFLNGKVQSTSFTRTPSRFDNHS